MSEEDDKGQEKPKTSQLAIFFCGTKMKKIKIVKLFLSVVILIVLWFIAIDKSWFIEGCENCLYHRDVIKYRFFTIPIYEHSSETHTPVEIIAQALGSPCPHKNWYVRHKYRWWGLVFCVCPCESGTTGFNYDIESWYHASLREKLREASERNPTLGEEFRQRVVYKNDWDYWSRFKFEIKDGNEEQFLLESNNLSENELTQIADKIRLIKWLRFEYGEVQPDENAMLILALGKKVAPYLVEKITDDKPSQWLSWANEGDVAHMVLSLIYDRHWPTSDITSLAIPSGGQLFPADYLGFLKSPDEQQNHEDRRKLQEAWNKVVEESEKTSQ